MGAMKHYRRTVGRYTLATNAQVDGTYISAVVDTVIKANVLVVHGDITDVFNTMFTEADVEAYAKR